ncbi:MAG: four helix bundle protein [Clostridia bacterium]|nr:four helix bundle protein [Clostridia bacterium]
MRENKVLNLLKEFALKTIELCKTLKNKESVMSNQLQRSATSIGANIHEADYAQGKNDFVAKLKIALKESHESQYWLELLYKSEYKTEKILPN